MSSFQAILEHLPVLLLVLSRISGVFVFAPLLSSGSVPRQVRVYLAGAMTIAVYPSVDTTHALGMDLTVWSLAPLMAQEIAIGAVVGLIAAIPLLALELSGVVMGQQLGLSIASVLNPSLDIPGDNLGQLLFVGATLMYLAMGGMELVFGSLVNTFGSMPVGDPASVEALGGGTFGLIAALMDSGFDMAMRVAMPVVVIIFVETVVVGFVMKTVPSLNILSFGFPIRILLGVAVLAASISFVATTLQGELQFVFQALHQWSSGE